MFDEELDLDEYIEQLYEDASERYDLVDDEDKPEPEEESEGIPAEDSADEIDIETDKAKRDTLDASERIAADLASEREQILEAEIYLDSHPEEKEPETDVEEEKDTQKREMLKTAITRIENSARTIADFENVEKCWDKLEQNESRRLRNHELTRGDVPLEFGKAMDGVIFPLSYMEPKWKQVMSGYLLEIIHDCPHELHELVADGDISNMMKSLNLDQQEIFYWHFIRQLSCPEVGRIRGQTDRNIRKRRGVIIQKLRKQIKKVLVGRIKAGYSLTLRQREFLDEIEKAVLDESKNG